MIKSITAENKTAAEDISSQSDKLKEQVGMLKEAISFFKVEVEKKSDFQYNQNLPRVNPQIEEEIEKDVF